MRKKRKSTRKDKIRYAIVNEFDEFLNNEPYNRMANWWRPAFTITERSYLDLKTVKRKYINYNVFKEITNIDIPEIKIIEIKTVVTHSDLVVDWADPRMIFETKLRMNRMNTIANAFEKVRMENFVPPLYAIMRKGRMRSQVSNISDTVVHSDMMSFFWDEDEFALAQIGLTGDFRSCYDLTNFKRM